MELVRKLKNVYGENEPILIEEIRSVFSNYSIPRVAQFIEQMIDENKIVRFDTGIYYIPTETIFGKSKLNTQKVVEKKYIQDKKDVYGFCTGVTFANALGITMQVPNIIEIYTNKETTRVRDVKVGNQTIKLRRARVKITDKNYKELQLLELLNQLSNKDVIDNKYNIVNYIKEEQINIKSLLSYIQDYPAKTFKNLTLTGAVYGTI